MTFIIAIATTTTIIIITVVVIAIALYFAILQTAFIADSKAKRIDHRFIAVELGWIFHHQLIGVIRS